MSRRKFPPPALQFCYNSLCYVVTFFLLLFSISITTYFVFVATELLPVAWICCRDRLFLCHNRVFFTPCRWPNFLSPHWIPCHEKLALAPVTYLLFSVVTKNFSIANEISYSAIFFIATKIFAFSSLLCRNIRFYVTTIFLSFSSLSITTIVTLSQQHSPQP